MDGKKICTKCNIEKELTEFHKAKKGYLGVKAICKICRKTYDKIQGKIYKTENKDKIKVQNKIYKTENKEKIKVYGKNYRAKNREKRSVWQIAYYIKNKEKIASYGKDYRTKYKEKRNAYQNSRRKENSKIRLNDNISGAIYRVLKGNKNGSHWEVLVGYTFNDLIKHLEKQFEENMTWDNYGKWHIDHIVPISVFNFTKPEHIDFKRCWALENLQPLWAEDNFEKNTKLTKHFQPSLRI